MNKNDPSDKSLSRSVKGFNTKSPQRIPKEIDELPRKITRTPKRSLKTESLENLSPLAKRLQKTKSESNEKLDVWLIKKGLIQSTKYSNDKKENYCSSLKLPKTYTKEHSLNQSGTANTGHKDGIKQVKENLLSKSANLNSSRENKITKSKSQTLNKNESPENISHLTKKSVISNKRLFNWLNKEELTSFSKVADKKQKENESVRYLRSCLNKNGSPELNKVYKSKQISKVDSTKQKILKSIPTELFKDLPPTTRKLRERTPAVSIKKIDDWLIKKEFTSSPNILGRKQKDKKSTVPSSSRLHKNESPQLKKTSKSPKKNREKLETNTISPKTDKAASIKEKVIKTPKHLRSRNKTDNTKEKVTKTIEKSFSSKTKPAFRRYNSSDSCELPSFANILNNKSTKCKKVTTTKKEQKALFKKYGVHVPSVDEILRDKERLENDKCKLEQFIPMNDDSLEFKPFIEEAPQEKENILHCKHLTNQQLLKSFKRNMKYLNNIISGNVKNERHDKYFDKNRIITNSLSDLTYNTSTIVFNFDQNEYLIELLKEAFDPEDKKTRYFFQVLLPELCLKIFMETHKMDYDVAVKHLDKQPILDN